MDIENPDEAESIPEIGEDGEAVPVQPIKRKRGRPKGSKTKNRRERRAPPVDSEEPQVSAGPRRKVKLPLGGFPPMAAQALARAPLMAADFVAVQFFDMPLAPYMPPDLIADCERSFLTWVQSLDVELSPGEAYLASVVGCVGGAIFGALMTGAVKAHAKAAPVHRNGATGAEVVHFPRVETSEHATPSEAAVGSVEASEPGSSPTPAA